MQLGLQLQPVEHKKLNISLLYTDVAKFASSQTIASFIIEPYHVGEFATFLLQVTSEEVKLVYKCDKKESRLIKRYPEELLFDPASTLYIGQAGPIIKGNLDVSKKSARRPLKIAVLS